MPESLPPTEFIPRDRTAPARESYLAYLNSPHWRWVRNRALKRVAYRCERCDAKRDLQVHHKSYERLGAERPDDLEVLCFSCHADHHVAEPADPGLGIYLKLVSEILSANVWKTVADISEETKVQCVKLKIPGDPRKIQQAVALICGTRLKVTPAFGVAKPYVSAVECEDVELSHEQAIELLRRLFGSNLTGTSLIKSMPEPYGADGEMHAEKVREQINEMRAEMRQSQPKPKRRPMRERLEAIFSEKP